MQDIVARSESELIAAVRAADASGVAVRVAGAGSPPAAAGFDGRLITVATRGIDVNDDGCDADDLVTCAAPLVTVAAGEDWAGFVALAIEREWAGIERLAAHRATVAGATIHNARAFGQAAADTVAAVRTWDRAKQVPRRFAFAECGFGEDGSRFSRDLLPDGSRRYVVLDVAFLLRLGGMTDPLRDPRLAGEVGVQVGGRAPLARVRSAVLRLSAVVA